MRPSRYALVTGFGLETLKGRNSKKKKKLKSRVTGAFSSCVQYNVNMIPRLKRSRYIPKTLPSLCDYRMHTILQFKMSSHRDNDGVLQLVEDTRDNIKKSL